MLFVHIKATLNYLPNNSYAISTSFSGTVNMILDSMLMSFSFSFFFFLLVSCLLFPIYLSSAFIVFFRFVVTVESVPEAFLLSFLILTSGSDDKL